MSISVQATENHTALLPPVVNLDLDSSHTIISEAMDVLQRNFKEDTAYRRPLMSPQANVVFALDKEAANKMADYMSDKLCDVAGFGRNEFRFVRKSGANGEILQRIRLEFMDGVNAAILRKMMIVKDKMGDVLSAA